MRRWLCVADGSRPGRWVRIVVQLRSATAALQVRRQDGRGWVADANFFRGRCNFGVTAEYCLSESEYRFTRQFVQTVLDSLFRARCR